VFLGFGAGPASVFFFRGMLGSRVIPSYSLILLAQIAFGSGWASAFVGGRATARYAPSGFGGFAVFSAPWPLGSLGLGASVIGCAPVCTPLVSASSPHRGVLGATLSG
jgi:hypothetical protein